MRRFGQSSPALLIAAHGERRDGAANEGVAGLAAILRGRGIAREVAAGFVKGEPPIPVSLRSLGDRHVIVYPLFLADGHFVRERLPRLLEAGVTEGARRRITLLPPLGLDPLFPGVVASQAVAAAQTRGLSPWQADMVLLAHGSRTDPGSRSAAERLAASLRLQLRFRSIRTALIEEPPSLAEAVSDRRGPVLVIGLFAGEGMHAAADAPRLVAELDRGDVVFAGPAARLEGLAEVVAAAVRRVLNVDRATAA